MMRYKDVPNIKRISIDINQFEYKETLRYFCESESTVLPVTRHGKILGTLDLFNVLKINQSEHFSEDMIDQHYCSYTTDDEVQNPINSDKNIVLLVDKDNRYYGFIDKAKIQLCWLEEKFKQENAAFDELKEEFEAIFESSYDGIYIADGLGFTLRINKACERIEGIKAANVIGRHMDELVNTGIYSESVSMRVLKEKKPVTILQKVQNGKEVLATGNPIFKNGVITRVVTNSRDITELNQLKRELNETKLIKDKYEQELELLRTQDISFEGYAFFSDKMRRIAKMALHVAKVDTTVLIQGESGVGKEIISRLIHQNSGRRHQAFIKIDCSAIPENLLESELFGYEKGSFTGALHTGKIGLIELANEGTLFLDEIGDLPLHMQAKILRTLQDREIIRVGGSKSIPLDIRIIAATNKDLMKMTEEKLFREDLYYRLNVVPIVIPPLRERKDEIDPLIALLTNRYNQKYGLNKQISIDASNAMQQHDWPGNIRELENMVERLIVTSSHDTIRYEDLPVVIKQCHLTDKMDHASEELTSYRDMIDHFEKKLLLDVMSQSDSTLQMADILKVDKSTVTRKLKKHQIPIHFR